MNNHIEPNRALAWCYIFKLVCVAAGALAVYLGYDLFIRGVTGHASISIDTQTIRGQLINASPGLFFAIGGFIVIFTAIRKRVDTSSVSQTPHKFQSVQFANAADEDYESAPKAD